MPDSLAYIGPAATVLRNGRHVAPFTPLDPDEFGEAVKAGDPIFDGEGEEVGQHAADLPDEREFYEEQGWIEKIEPPEELRGDALKARADELGIEGASSMKADELRAAVKTAETEAASAAGGE